MRILFVQSLKTDMEQMADPVRFSNPDSAVSIGNKRIGFIEAPGTGRRYIQESFIRQLGCSHIAPEYVTASCSTKSVESSGGQCHGKDAASGEGLAVASDFSVFQDTFKQDAVLGGSSP